MEMLKSSPESLAMLKQNNPRLAEAFTSGNNEEFAKVIITSHRTADLFLMRYTYTSVESRHFGVPRYVCVAMVAIVIIEEAATLLQASFFRSLVVARGLWMNQLV